MMDPKSRTGRTTRMLRNVVERFKDDPERPIKILIVDMHHVAHMRNILASVAREQGIEPSALILRCEFMSARNNFAIENIRAARWGIERSDSDEWKTQRGWYFVDHVARQHAEEKGLEL